MKNFFSNLFGGKDSADYRKIPDKTSSAQSTEPVAVESDRKRVEGVKDKLSDAGSFFKKTKKPELKPAENSKLEDMTQGLLLGRK